jgi:hypothetical protein
MLGFMLVIEDRLEFLQPGEKLTDGPACDSLGCGLSVPESRVCRQIKVLAFIFIDGSPAPTDKNPNYPSWTQFPIGAGECFLTGCAWLSREGIGGFGPGRIMLLDKLCAGWQTLPHAGQCLIALNALQIVEQLPEGLHVVIIEFGVVAPTMNKHYDQRTVRLGVTADSLV